MNAIDIFISLIRAELKGEVLDSHLLDSLNESVTEQIFNLAEKHDLAHFVSGKIIQSGILKSDSPLVEKLQKQEMLAFYRYKRIEHEFTALKDVLTKNEIPFVPLKGSVIRQYYSKPWMRTSCDIDILVKEDDFDKAVSAIERSLSYSVDPQKGYHDVSLYSQSGVHLELHFNILENDKNLDKVLSNVWDYAYPKSDGSFEHLLTDDFFIFHQIAHMAYHFKNGGCGIRPFIDLFLLAKNVKCNEQSLYQMCDECGISVFYNSVKSLIGVWFDNCPHSDLTLKMQNYLMYGGVYGTMENKIAASRNRSGGRFKYILKRIFMPYDNLKIIYPSLEGKKWLTPLYEVRRWGNLIFSKRIGKGINEAKSTIAISGNRANETEQLFSDIGLKQ